MEVSQCCRTCLSEQNLNHIFATSEQSEKYTEVIFNTTGIKVQIDDNLPKYMCTQCMNFVNDSHKFRIKCKNSEKLLIQQAELKPFCDIKLESSISEYTTTIDISNVNVNFDCDFHDYDDNITLAEYHVKTEELNTKNEAENIDKDTENATVKSEDLEEVRVRRKYTKRKEKDKLEPRVKRNYVRRTDSEKQEPRIKRKYVRKKPFIKNGITIEKEPEEKETNGEDKVKAEAEPNVFKCPFCPREFAVKAAMHTHKKIHTKRVVCEHCGMRFPEPRRLLRHCRAKHGYEKTDKCSYCDYRGVDADQVKVHERTHTGEKPYVCAQCGASFSRSSSYHQHVDSHLTHKTVQCTLCPRLFKSIKFMRIHRVRHTNRYTYACGVCDNLFARRYNVVKHLKRIHSLKPDAENVLRKKRPDNEISTM